MSSFLNQLVISPMPDGRRWKLVEPFRYRVGSMDSDNIIAVPVDTITDFASIPRMFWSILPPWGRYGKAAVLHDYLYKAGGCTRLYADYILHEAMGVLGVAWWKRWVMYKAVRVGAWAVWKKYRKEEVVSV